ncbi:MAG: monofunctional biosynthetic peptidoglycan transglycosylase [Burkholderiales bacterium]|nr:monofunctional biosynthetic peptidoglycan transglycosylase [Burkholderiales bacterium]
MLRRLYKWSGRIFALAVMAILCYQLWLFAQVWYRVDHDPSSSAFMQARLEEMQKTDPDAKIAHEWVPYRRISSNLKRALIAAEDAKFLDHEGFDWEGIQKAYEKDVRKGKIVAGGSTISQQLSKNLFLSGSRSPWRKAQESIITLMIEHMMSKQRIFELYLNSIEWGDGVFGAEAAARHYYGTDAAHLSASQAARLASMVPNPRYYDKHRNSGGLARKTEIILGRMNSAQIP